MAAGVDADERALVTGANGFIGSSLVSQLLDGGAHVFAVARGEPARLRHLVDDERLTVIDADLSRPDDVRALLAGAQPTVAFHLAWLTQPGAYLRSIPWNFESVRFGLTLVEELLEQGCRRIVGAGTCAEYELGPAVLYEDSPTRPSSVYGSTKLALATAALPAAAEAGASLAWARIFYVYGPMEDSRRAFPRIVDGGSTGNPPSLNQPDQLRDFLHVADVASALSTLGERGAHGAVNVCSGRGVTLRELWRRARQAIDPAATDVSLGELAGTDEPPIVGDSTRLRDLGWAPRFGLDDGVQDAVDWWRRSAAEG